MAKAHKVEVEAEEEETSIYEKAPPPREEVLSATVTSLLDLTSHRCKWPIGEPRDEGFGFCGRRVASLVSSYCDDHDLVAYQQHRPLRSDHPLKLKIGAGR